MKRLIKNGIAIAIILVVGFLAFNFYTPKESPIKGDTVSERLEGIRARVDKRDYISITDARREEVSGVIVVRYQFNFTAPLKIFLEDQNSQSQNLLGLGSGNELTKAINEYRGAIDDLLRLTLKYIVPFDPAVRAIIIDIRWPDGSMQRAVGLVEELRVIPLDAPADVFREKVRFVNLDLVPSTKDIR